ncbi:MAG: class I SAM-dependent methyltransferase [Gammaproteobacteria bacterium]|nr:class I SAM-dependent methyltransferase [Gammaproteobacteria bacterium]
MQHWEKQKAQHDARYAAGPRGHTVSSDPLVNYVTRWRLREAFRRLRLAAGNRIDTDSRILVMCAGEGLEGSVLYDLGYRNVTVSDISDVGVGQAISRDSRLKGVVLNAEAVALDDNAYDVVVVQDGLHHLRSPVAGFTEMLRVGAVAAIFLEPHQSLAGSLLGTKWERNGEAINYVFRWNRRLVGDVSSSYLVEKPFDNLSFSFWHHNIVLGRLGRLVGGGRQGVLLVRTLKVLLDGLMGRWGNQFCGLVVKQ